MRVFEESRVEKKTIVETVLDLETVEGVSPSRWQAFKDFAAVFAAARARFSELNLNDMIDLLLARSGYLEALREEGSEGQDRIENIAELKSVTRKFAKLRGNEALEAFLQEVALVADQDSYNPDTGQALTLMTFHSAKGLEFNTVFMVGMEEGLLPHANSLIEPAELEEERRLCYVGITRAQARLYFTLTRQRMIYGSLSTTTPSRFLAELGEEGVEYYSEE